MYTDEQVEKMLNAITEKNEFERQHSNSWFIKAGIYIGLLFGGLATIAIVTTVSGIFGLNVWDVMKWVGELWIVGVLITIFVIDRKFRKGSSLH